MNHCPGDICKRRQEIRKQPLPIAIVFQDTPEKKILVQLIGKLAAAKRIIIDPGRVGIPVRVTYPIST
jgi:hypothetical protein